MKLIEQPGKMLRRVKVDVALNDADDLTSLNPPQFVANDIVKLGRQLKRI